MGSRITFATAILLSLTLLGSCANPEAKQASRQAAQEAADVKDDATCREKGLTPGTEPYDACRNTLAQAAADEAALQERRRIEFQKTLGAGTSDYTGR
jgi:hypothetical protein